MQLLRGRHNASLSEVCARALNASKFSDLKEIGSVATIGNFDGVHIGHQQVLAKLKREANKRQLPTVVILFEPQPLEYFKGKEAPARLMRFRDKFEAIRSLNIDFIFCLKFDARLSSLTARQFVEEILVEHLSIKHLVIGDDFRFGGDRCGDFDLLSKLGTELGFTVENTETVSAPEQTTIQTQRASSTYVRSLLQEGEFDLAESVLGRPFSINGRVMHGEKLGRKLGFPTANIGLGRLSVPFKGVYAVTLTILAKNGEITQSVSGVANIGVKPTVGTFKPNLEVHLLAFKGDIYGKRVQVRFHKKIRDEKRFDGLDALTKQITADVRSAEAYFGIEDQASG